MDEEINSPFYVSLFFVLRCLVPMIIMLGFTYLLKRLGLVSEPPAAPLEKDNGNDHPSNSQGGGLLHDNP